MLRCRPLRGPTQENDVISTPSRLPSRPLSYVRKGGCVVETCTNTLNGLPLLRPGPEANERIFGALGRAAEYYRVGIHAFGILSTHYHLLYSVDDTLQMSRFQNHLNSNVAREVGRLHGLKDKFWARRYRSMGIGDERADQRERLKYCLAQATRAGLVESPLDWPAPTAAEALLHGEPVVGYWFNRTKEYNARRSQIDFAKYDYATRYEIDLQPLPAFQDDSPEEYRAMVAEILAEIEEEAATQRGGRPARGADAVQAQDPCEQLHSTRKKSPAPMLFFSKQPEVRKAMGEDYKNFRAHFMEGSKQLLEAAEEGYWLDPKTMLPNGSFAPTVVESILYFKGFNPEAAFPKGCFPRAWPFVGGELSPPPPTPPTRPLVFEEIAGELKIVHRGEIPTVRVPASDLDASSESRGLAVPNILESGSSGSDFSRDPP